MANNALAILSDILSDISMEDIHKVTVKESIVYALQ